MIINLFRSEDHYVRLIALSLPVPSILGWLCILCFPSHQIIGNSRSAHADQGLRPGYHTHIHRSGMRGLLSTVLVQVLRKARTVKVWIDSDQGSVLLLLSTPTEELVCGLLDGHNGSSIVKLQPSLLRVATSPSATTAWLQSGFPLLGGGEELKETRVSTPHHVLLVYR